VQAYRKELESRRSRMTEDNLWEGPEVSGGAASVIPEAAFGPPKGGKYENLSVVRQRVAPVASIQALLGDPTTALGRLLDTSIASPSSGKKATLINATQRQDGLYEFEYLLSLPNGRKVHTWSAVGLKQPTRAPSGVVNPGIRMQSPGIRAQSPLLYTMTLVQPQENLESTPSNANRAREILMGFKILN